MRRVRSIVLLLAATMTGCATTMIDTSRPPPADWPALEVVVKKTSDAEVKRVCPNAGLVFGLGCSVVIFSGKLCTIYLSTDNQTVVEHERMHCLGYDHPGESTMRDAWENWKRSQRG